MKNGLLSLFAVFLAFSMNAQKIANGTFTDCNNQSMTIYDVLATGKVLMIASKGLDCGICKSHATDYQNFVSSNNNIEGWGAMLYIYNPSQAASCTDMNSWVSTYSWNNVFTFADDQLRFFDAGTPRYIVVDPSDSTIDYQGSSITTAKQRATALAATVGVEELDQIEWSIYQNQSDLYIEGLKTQDIEVSLIDLKGQLVLNESLNGNQQFVLPLEKMESGIYLLHIRSNGKSYYHKLHWM